MRTPAGIGRTWDRRSAQISPGPVVARAATPAPSGTTPAASTSPSRPPPAPAPVTVLFDADGRAFDPSSALFLLPDADKSFLESINPGNTVIDAPLLFDVPLGVTLASIELHDSPFSAGVVLPLPDAVSVVAAPPGASQDSSVAAPPPFPGEPISIADRRSTARMFYGCSYSSLAEGTASTLTVTSARRPGTRSSTSSPGTDYPPTAWSEPRRGTSWRRDSATPLPPEELVAAGAATSRVPWSGCR